MSIEEIALELEKWADKETEIGRACPAGSIGALLEPARGQALREAAQFVREAQE